MLRSAFLVSLPLVALNGCVVSDDGRPDTFGELGEAGSSSDFPTRIEAEDYVAFNESDAVDEGEGCETEDGVDLEATTDAGGRCTVSYAAEGEWLEYEIEVPEAGRFDLTLRVASGFYGQTARVYVDGGLVGTIQAPSSGWDVYDYRTIRDLAIGAGTHRVRVFFETGGVNLNYLEFFAAGTAPGDDGTTIDWDAIGGLGDHGPQLPPVESNGQLAVCGTKLCNEAGDPIQLRGMSTHGIQWYGWGDCVTEDSLTALADDWGADILRISLYVQESGYEDDPEGFTADAQAIADAAIARGMYFILDWHILNPGDPMLNLALAEQYFSEMAERYADVPNVLYEIANEPVDVPWSRIREYSEAIIPVIRDRDPDAVILIGTEQYSSLGLSWGESHEAIVADPVPFDNVMYTFHFYAASHRSFLSGFRAAADVLPIFVTEWGSQDASGDGADDLETAQLFIDTMEERQISWTAWNYSDDTRTSGAFVPGTCESGGPWSGESLKTSATFIRDRILRGGDQFASE